jgi:L-2-hydroxyglutarate oxidase LhgO
MRLANAFDAFDIAIVGGGIVGLATAHRLLEVHPDVRLVLLEKEAEIAAHQTGHNSGVLHSGIYYKPGSAKARTCVEGARLMRDFCAREGIPLEICGKVVVATDESEVPALEELWRRGTANGVPGLAIIGPERLREIEPHAAGVRALHVPGAGILDFREVARALARLVAAAGGEIRTSARVRRLRSDGEGVVLETQAGKVRSRILIACGGLYSDRLARMEVRDLDVRIVPFRGEYYTLLPERCDLVRGLIYPVPDPRFPFLGVHFTRQVGGGVEAGPNAVLAFHREGYTKARVSLRDLGDVLCYPGFWRLARRYWRTGAGEVYRSLSKRAFVRALQKLVPDVRVGDLARGGSGVRAQALVRTGELVDDFLIVDVPRSLHVCNAPSPAATASLAIAEEIVRRAQERFGDVLGARATGARASGPST